MGWQSVLRNLQRATSFTTRRRERDGRRRLRRSGIAVPLAGRARRERRPASFLGLALPGLVVGRLGLPRLMGPATPMSSLMVTAATVGCLLFALRAATARASRPVRVVATACCLAYPALGLLLRLGLL